MVLKLTAQLKLEYSFRPPPTFHPHLINSYIISHFPFISSNIFKFNFNLLHNMQIPLIAEAYAQANYMPHEKLWSSSIMPIRSFRKNFRVHNMTHTFVVVDYIMINDRNPSIVGGVSALGFPVNVKLTPLWNVWCGALGKSGKACVRVRTIRACELCAAENRCQLSFFSLCDKEVCGVCFAPRVI